VKAILSDSSFFLLKSKLLFVNISFKDKLSFLKVGVAIPFFLFE